MSSTWRKCPVSPTDPTITQGDFYIRAIVNSAVELLFFTGWRFIKFIKSLEWLLMKLRGVRLLGFDKLSLQFIDRKLTKKPHNILYVWFIECIVRRFELSHHIWPLSSPLRSADGSEGPLVVTSLLRCVSLTVFYEHACLTVALGLFLLISTLCFTHILLKRSSAEEQLMTKQLRSLCLKTHSRYRDNQTRPSIHLWINLPA